MRNTQNRERLLNAAAQYKIIVVHKGAENDSAESEKSVFFFALVRGQFATFPRDKRIELIFAVDLSGPTDGAARGEIR
jgi:hypothetical protein